MTGIVGGRLEDGADAWVLQAGRDMDLTFEALRLLLVAKGRFQDLHRDIAFQVLVTRLPHPSRGATAEFTQQSPASGDQFAGSGR
jgi:hypothetical protein